MLFDRCTWDNDYKVITQKIRAKLLEFAGASKEDYTAVLMQGSGTFAVESVMTSTISNHDKVLIISNGAYGERIVKTAQYIGLSLLVNIVFHTMNIQMKMKSGYFKRGFRTLPI